MRRRDFLSMCGLAAAGCLTDPTRLIWTPGPQFAIDVRTKTIGIRHGTVTVAEFYRWLLDRWDDVDMMPEDTPFDAPTPHHLRAINGWSLDAPSFQRITEGAIQQDGSLWATTLSLGPTVPAGTPILWSPPAGKP